jgi:shikimate dehydrogenase
MGQPIAGNPTQYMMEKAFAEAGIDSRFLTLEVSPENLCDAVKGMRAMGFRGGELAAPHTAAVAEHLDRLTPAAEIVGEVNCIFRDGGELVGENTIGKALLQALAKRIDPQGVRVAILGAGSAARAVAVELALAGASEITIVNRSMERGQALLGLLAERTNAAARLVHWAGHYHLEEETSVLVHATSIFRADSGVRLPVDLTGASSGVVVAEMNFDPPLTSLLRAASEAGCATVDGLSVLVNQAAIAFKIWTGIDADEGVMREAVEEFLMV